MNPCTLPRHLGDTRYVIGQTCTWHGPIEAAGEHHNATPCCPSCGGPLMEAATETELWLWVQPQKRSFPQLEEMLRWSAGRCYPDFNTLENAWRQAQDGAQ